MKSLAILLSMVLAAAQCFAASITCTFTATDGTLLEDYNVATEATWTENTGKASGNIQISDSNRAHTTTTNDAFYYVDNFTPATLNYDVQATVTFLSVPTSNTNYFGVGGRGTSTTGSTGYLALLVRTSGGWQIQLLRYGSQTLETANITTPAVNDVTTLKLIMREHTILVQWGGTTVIDHSVDDSTGSYLTTVGYPTLFMKGITSHLTDSTGLHVDDYTVTDAGSVNTTGTITVDNDDLWYNHYDGTGNPRQTAFAEWKFTTNAQILKITGTTDMEDDKASLNNLGLFVDDVWMAPNLDFTANGTQTFTFRLRNDVGATKTVRIVAASQIFPPDETYVQGSYIDSVELQDWFNTPTQTIIPPSAENVLCVYGDSISVGDSATSPARWAWTTMLRNRWGGRNVIVDGFGYRSLYEDAYDGTARTALASRLASTNAQYLWMAIGTNDFGADQNWNATDFGTAYADLLDKIHTAAPNMKIFCQSPIQRIAPSDENTNGEGSTLADYRTAISTAVSTRTSYCTYVEGAAAAILPDSGMSTTDGVHPNSEGHRIYAEYVHNYLYKTSVETSNATVVGASGTTIVK